MIQTPHWYRRQVFGGLIGMTPLLVLSVSVFHALAYSLAYCMVLVTACTLVWALRSVVPLHQRLAYTVLISSVVTTVLAMVGEVFAPGIVRTLGVFLPLLAVQPGLIGIHGVLRLETKYSSLLLHLLKTVGTLMFAMLVFGFIRGLLGTATVQLWRTDVLDYGLDLSAWFTNPPAILLDTSLGFILVAVVLMLVPLDQEDTP